MSLRLRLILAFLVLSVVPLGAMTWFTYTSSVKNLREAAEHDSNMLAGELTNRMQLITAQLGERMENLMDMDAEGAVASVPPARAQTPRAPVTADAGAPRPAPAPAPAAAPPAPDPALAAAAQASGEQAEVDARVAVRLGDAAMLLNNIEIRGLPTSGGRRGGRPPTGADAASATSSPTSATSSPRNSAPSGSSASSDSSGRSTRGEPNRGFSRGQRPPRPDGSQPPPPPLPPLPPLPSSRSGERPDEPPILAVGPMLPPAPFPPSAPGETDPIRIDLAQMRREIFQQISPNRSLSDMDREERARIISEINQRILGIQQGIREGLKISAAAIQKEADEAKRESLEEASKSAAVTPAPATPAPPKRSPAPAAAKPAPAAATAPVAPKAPAAAQPAKAPAMTGNRINVQRERNGVVRQVNAEVNIDELMAMVFSATPRDRGEVPFAIAKDGRLYAATPEDRRILEPLGPEINRLAAGISNPEASGRRLRLPAWTVVETADPTGSGFTFGIARPVAAALREIRRTAARSAGLGMLFILMTLIAVVPLSNGLTKNLSRLNAGVHRIAGGDYMARVSVKDHGEIGRLAQAFNQMAEQVSKHQQAAIGQERIRRELELGRQIQHDMLPREVLRTAAVEARGASTPAGEVGGDFFNYFETKGGDVALLIGDVSGKGVGAALLMANIQASLRTRLMMGQDLRQLADEVDGDLQANTPGPVYATLFVGAIDPSGRRLRYVNAGHNPQYILRRKGGLVRLESSGLPIGLLAGRGYVEGQLELEPGDVLFCYTDGCVEAENKADEMFGADAFERELLAAGAQPTEDLLRHMETVIQRFRNGREPADDATMMVARVS